MEFSSSSSSSSSSSFLKSGPHFIYDVFINFWGEDIGKKFISHLYYALLEAQVKTFINEESLPKELELKEHMRAIAASKIAIIVFSKTYAESSSCLLELEEIIECLQTFGQIVLHVFYDVDPLDVRDQVSDFGKALQETAEKSYSGEQVEHVLSRWSRALTTASDSTGWDVRYFEHDAQLVERIVSDVKTFLDYKDLLITPFPVGIDSRVEDVVKCIESQSTKVCMIGICGMRGSGKTTIAKAIYNRIYREFIGKSFTERIRLLSWDTAYKTNIRSQLLHNVLKFKVPDVRSRRTMVDHELSGRKLLIVFDDVNEFGQLEYLCKNREWFGQGTVIIITTRYVRLLNRFKVNYVYKMDVMNKNESLELFSWHAFREPKPRKEFGEVARNTVAYCGGLPLALEVLGSSLYDRIMVEWESISSQIPIDKVQEILKITFDDLTDMEKNIFLDVCCFFIGKERGYVTEILNDCGLLGNYPIEVLLRLGLVKVERNNKLQMHPLLHDIGKEIVRQSCPEEAEKRSRLWFQDDIKYVLKNNTGTEAIEGLSLKLHSTSRDCFETHAFKK
ncbi:disease resistance-like protein DSC2 [Vigna unguiculata]|uniref:disease resistance-like protein DSC2 n=1 Tax=Vigna unguiculata TaxID=3917 RepID=UPI001015EFCB|nr:disease resistance-like protein DSC2 [Vigna unguiculata]XP_027906918.1 disease resistance-like protein DSC2 [Vigna unguiculata]